MTKHNDENFENLLQYYYHLCRVGMDWVQRVTHLSNRPEYVELPVIGRYHIDWDHMLQVSKTACKQVQEIPMSPYMKNALVKYDHFTDEDRLTIDSPESEAEKYIASRVKAELEKQFGPENTEYNRELDCLNPAHYAVDCWRNFKPDMRQIVTGQAEERAERFLEYAQPLIGHDIMQNQFIRIGAKRVLDTSVRNIHKVSKIEDWTAPFQKRKTQVSFPFCYRDDVVVSEQNDFEGQLKPWYGQTYGQLCIIIAEGIAQLSDSEMYSIVEAICWYVGYARNQRKKGRALIAESRLGVLYGNQMTQPETEASAARDPLYLGYNSRAVLREGLIKQATFAKNNNFCMENMDYKGFDGSIDFYWIALGGAYWMVSAADKKSREVVFYRTLLGMVGKLVDGANFKIYTIYGRIFSGEIETNKTENKINATASYANLIHIDKEWTNEVFRRSLFPIITIGDDILETYRRTTDQFHDMYVKFMKEVCGFTVHPDKGEFGCFFLQNRVFQLETGEFICTYPWTRVLLSCLMLEQGKGLGPAGWTIATWAKLANIQEYKPGLRFVRDLLCEFDEYKLMLDKPIQEVIDMLKKEDAEALEKHKRARSSLEMINDNDPGKEKVTYENPGYLARLQAAIRSA